jgi:hypothetical protein
LYRLSVKDAFTAPGTYFALFVDDTCIYATEKHERCLQTATRITAVKSWCERWNIKINEGKSQAIFFSRRITVPDDELQLNEGDVRFVNNLTYLGVTFDKRTWGHHIERTIAKALSTYLRTCKKKGKVVPVLN